MSQLPTHIKLELDLAIMSLPVPRPAPLPTVPARSDNAIANTVPVLTAPIGADLEDVEVWNSVLIAERMLATASPCEHDGMRFLLGMIASK
jgi:hypothetical protein